jgi:hypothetical protein
MSGQIFISYRREESRWSARSLHDRLCRDFDPKQIFMDIDAIALGEDFVKAIETTVAKCDVLIAVIGNNWLTTKDDDGDRRLDNPEDIVRMEIGVALKREISMIPVLVDGASIPRATDLPEDLKSLVRRNALRITDTSFDGDCQRLAAAIRLVLENAAAVEREDLVATSIPPAQPKADKPSADTLSSAGGKVEPRAPEPTIDPVGEVVRPAKPPEGDNPAKAVHLEPSMGRPQRESPGARTWLRVGGVVALVVVAVILYFGFQHPEAKSTMPGSITGPSVSASSPGAVIVPSEAPKRPAPEASLQPSAPAVSYCLRHVVINGRVGFDPRRGFIRVVSRLDVWNQNSA